MGDLFFHRLDRPITGMAKEQQKRNNNTYKTECAGDRVVIGEECRYEKWLECDEICQSRKRHQPDREMLYKVSFSPRIVMRASSIKKTPARARVAWLGLAASNYQTSSSSYSADVCADAFVRAVIRVPHIISFSYLLMPAD